MCFCVADCEYSFHFISRVVGTKNADDVMMESVRLHAMRTQLL